MRQAARTDRNHGEIREGLRRIGAVVIDTFQLKNAFDMLVAYRGRLFIIEVKDPEQPPSKRRLTQGERECRDRLQGAKVPYYVVTSLNQAIQIVTTPTP